jgi:hypothetical protein
MKVSGILFAAALAVLGAKSAEAACSCECVNGHAENICQSTIDIKQICVNICPASIPNYGVPHNNYTVVPPPGARRCTNEQVLNPTTHLYETKTLCHQ